jgi:hypothetical protein
LQTILHRINLNSDKGHSTKELSKKIFFVWFRRTFFSFGWLNYGCC